MVGIIVVILQWVEVSFTNLLDGIELLLGFIFISVYLVYDIRSGNYRKLLSTQDEHDQQPHL